MLTAQTKEDGIDIYIDGNFETVVVEWGALTNQILMDIHGETGQRLTVQKLADEAMEIFERRNNGNH